jgi:hypothetical protein
MVTYDLTFWTESGEEISVSNESVGAALDSMREIFPDAILHGSANSITARNDKHELLAHITERKN